MGFKFVNLLKNISQNEKALTTYHKIKISNEYCIEENCKKKKITIVGGIIKIYSEFIK